MLQRLKNRLIGKRFLTPFSSGSARLTRRGIFILPTRHGLLLALVLVVMLLGALNYNNSLGLALTFLMGSVATISIVHTYRNLAGVRVGVGRIEPVFAGETARFPITLAEDRGLARPRVRVEAERAAAQTTDVPAGAHGDVVLRTVAARRGRLTLGRCRVSTRYPLGLFNAWAWVVPAATCIVYPTPARDTPALAREPAGTSGAAGAETGDGDDFAGLREYRTGDSPRHIAWKAVARGQGWLTKRFAGAAAATPVWLDWHALPEADVETRLAWLCRAALDAEAALRPYGLRLPDATIEPRHGPEHAERVLTALALFGTDEAPDVRDG